MATNVPTVTWAPTGFQAPPESEVLAGVQQDINVAFGGNLNFGTTNGSQTNATPQGQLAASMAAIIGNVNDAFLYFATQTDPAYAEGRMQDAIGRIYFIERNGPIPTTLLITCTGATGTAIPVGSLIVDPGGNTYGAVSAGTIGLSGTVILTFAATVAGSLSVPNSVAIYQAIAGWDTVTLISGVAGQNTESRAAFETRRGLSTAANSLGSLPSIYGTVLSVPGVTQALVVENTSSSPTTNNGVTIAANSVYVVAYGGNPTEVAQAIWSRKAPGCAYGGGNTTVTIQDTSPGYSPPYPTYTVTYEIPNPLPLLFQVDIVNSVAVPANGTQLIQQAIINAAGGNPNAQNVIDGPQASIGSKVYASRFIPAVAALGTWAQGNVISLNIGSNNNPDAAVGFGYCAGTLLVLTFSTSGTVSAGQFVSISNGSGVIIPGTNIVSQISGTTGGAGQYVIDTNQSIGLGNLFQQSNNFANGTWGQFDTTVTASIGTSPDGTNDAWQLQRSTFSAGDNMSQNSIKTPGAVQYTLSIYARPGSGNYLNLWAGDGSASGFNNYVNATFNVETGAISTQPFYSGTTPFTNATATISPVGNGWYRCSMTFTTNTATQLFCSIGCCSNNSILFGTDVLNNTTLQIYGAQLMVGGIGPYYATTSSQSINQILGFANPDQTSVQVQLNQVPQVSAGNINVTYF